MHGKTVSSNLYDNKPVDHRNDEWCHNHTLKLDNISPMTERDKRLLESVKYKIIKQEGKDGIIEVAKMCPRCFCVVLIDTINRPLLRSI
jgi:hypothetical protein